MALALKISNTEVGHPNGPPEVVNGPAENVIVPVADS